MVTVKLKDIIGTKEELIFNEAISNFSCKDSDVEFFLKHKSFDYEKRNKSRTYLLLDKNKLFENSLVLIGYFTLSLKVFTFDSSVSKNKIKNIDGFAKDIRAVAAILIGQFGKDCITAQNIQGSDLFNLCMNRVYQIHNLVGSRIVFLECQDIPEVISFYNKNQFYFLQRNENDTYLQMIRQL